MCDMKKITNTEFISCIPRRWLNKLFIRAVVVLTDINITVAIQFIELVLEIWSVVKLLTYIGDVPLHLVFTVYVLTGQIFYMHSSDIVRNVS